MPARKQKSVPDIRSSKDISALKEVLKSHPITLVLVYADWCGHCTTYKADTWKNLSQLPNRTVGMAQLNSDVLEESPLKDAKISGYPSVLLVGNDGRPAEFKEAGEMTNAIPNARDLTAMTSIATAPQESLNEAVQNATDSSLNAPPTNGDPSANLTEEANANRRNSSSMILNSLSATSLDSPTLPNVEEDILKSQEGNAASGSEEMMGGSLYKALLDAGKMVAPAAALTMGAVWATKQTRRGKKSRKGKGKGKGRSLKLRGKALRALSAKLRR
jgi:hypothetical protein